MCVLQMLLFKTKLVPQEATTRQHIYSPIFTSMFKELIRNYYSHSINQMLTIIRTH